MRVCYFGIYNPNYSRNKILISGLRVNGIDVIECRTDKRGILKYLDLIKKHWKIRDDYDVLAVGYPGFQSVILARFLTRKSIVFDAFLSMYDSMVLDRGQASENSFRARYYWWLDKISMSLADLVLLDTEAHIRFISKEFNIKKEKFRRIFIGASTEIFYPQDKNIIPDKFQAVFFGTFIPLQGIEYIVRAAKILENDKDIIFNIIGSGQEKNKVLKLAESLEIKNVIFRDFLPSEKLREQVAGSQVCLGIFGDTAKTKRVIPNKVYECLAMKMPVITADTPAVRELFEDGELMFTKTADPESIVSAILYLKGQPNFAREISQKGYNKFTKEATPKVLGLRLKEIIESMI